ncbi:MAG: heme-dependent oxidative N-demethylase subunit alpha family protein [Chthoniobacteraceae bacterium]
MDESLFELPAGAFRFELGLRRGDVAFFRNADSDAPLLSERARWLAAEPDRYARALPGSEALIEDAAEFARSMNPGIAQGPSDLVTLGRSWAPDFLLLAPGAVGANVLQAGCVCFPTLWDLGEKMGKPMAKIHAPVPTLNDSLSRQIEGFLTALRPGVVWERWNWGLAATAERNGHPGLDLPRLNSAATIDGTWLRSEHQAFMRLPVTRAVLFGIRLVIEPLRETVGQPQAAARLAHLLETMPAAVAQYKGVATARAALVAELRRISA